MSKIFKGVIYTLAAIGFGYLLLLSLISFGPTPSCEVTDIGKAVSPDNQREAKLVVRKCPIEAAPMLELNLSTKLLPNESQIVVLGNATTTDADITWLSDTAVEVSLPVSFRLTQRPTELDGVEVRFVIKPPHTSFSAEALNEAG